MWLEDEYTGDVDKSKILLRSDVATDKGNKILRDILETGQTQKGAKDNYSRNFNKFIELYEAKAVDNSMQMFHFINALLNYSILLPISADNQDTALTIFSTLNNRGLPLSDADIFKSVLYKQVPPDHKKAFATKWKELEEETARYGESIQSLFYYHLFYLRALDGIEDSTIPGVRKYFMEKGKNRLRLEVLDQLVESLELWKVINGHEELPDEEWSKEIGILKTLDCLASYTNEYWKYPILIYYNQHKDKADFAKNFHKFLKKLLAMLVTRYLESPTVNAVKTDVLKLNVQIINSMHPEFFAGFRTEIPQEGPNPYFVTPHRNMVRMLLKLVAYDNDDQTELLPEKWEIEHIFPQKWDTSFFTLDGEEANVLLEHLGNKIPLEKPMNIRASNNYFIRKKEQYQKSNIAFSKALGNSEQEEWGIEDIKENDARMSDILARVINSSISDYGQVADAPKTGSSPTPEQAEMIRKLKEAGLI